jgi:hypothetical protein
MPQTFLALVALFVLSTYSLGQVRNTASVQRRAVGREVELAGADLARAHLARITELAFDEADAGGADLRFNASGLTPLAGLGPDAGETTPALYDDVDDLHGGASVLDSVEWDGSMLYFDVTTSVRYVQPSSPDAPAAAPSLAKEIVVTVIERRNGSLGRRPAEASLRAVVSAASLRPV